MHTYRITYRNVLANEIATQYTRADNIAQAWANFLAASSFNQAVLDIEKIG